jgi:hypothetical protein
VENAPSSPGTPITPAGGLPGYGRLPPPPAPRHPPTPLGKRYAFSTAHRPRDGEGRREDGLHSSNCRRRTEIVDASHDRGGVTLQDLRPLPGIESRAFTGRQPSLNALAGHFENLRMFPQALGDGAVVRDAPFLCESV